MNPSRNFSPTRKNNTEKNHAHNRRRPFFLLPPSGMMVSHSERPSPFFFLVNSPLKWLSGCRARGFTLIELLVTISIIVILLAAGVALLGGTGPQARKSAADMITGMIEQARTTAVTTRSHVVLAVVEPADFPAGDKRCRIGLFKVSGWTDDFSKPVAVNMISRWKILENGVVLIGGEVEGGLANPLDGDKITLGYGKGQVKARVIVFNPRGGLEYPEGSRPIAMRVAEGNYRNGAATPNRRAGSGTISENLIRIGRVTARPYRIDG
jgi:prepilin-type N-terminal cleavage/methylation domain-containing protein